VCVCVEGGGWGRHCQDATINKSTNQATKRAPDVERNFNCHSQPSSRDGFEDSMFEAKAKAKASIFEAKAKASDHIVEKNKK